MIKIIATTLLVLSASLCFSQTEDTSNVKRGSFDTYDELREKQSKDGVEKLTYLDSTFNFQVVIPDFLNLKETGTVYALVGRSLLLPVLKTPPLLKFLIKKNFRHCQTLKSL